MTATTPRLQAIALLVIGTVAVAGCGSARPADSSSDAGIQGTITIANLCPPAQQVTACVPRPFAAQVKVLNAAGRQVRTFRSDAAGRFRIDLAPGAYTVAPVSPRPNVPPVAHPVDVSVTTGRHVIVHIIYESGIS